MAKSGKKKLVLTRRGKLFTRFGMLFIVINSYARLPRQFYSKPPSSEVPDPHLIRANGKLAEELGVDPDWLLAGGAGLVDFHRLLGGLDVDEVGDDV